jgi:integrase
MPARPFSADEVPQIGCVLAERGDYRTRALILVGVNTGFRITELLSLRMGQLIGATGEVVDQVSVERRNLKGGKGAMKRAVKCRTVRLNTEARAAIADYLASLGRIPTGDEPLFPSRERPGSSISRSQAHRLLKSAAQLAGTDTARVSTHSLRKTFVAAIYAASGHDLIRTQRAVGHRSPLTTAAYLESTQAELDELVLSLPSSRDKFPISGTPGGSSFEAAAPISGRVQRFR